MSASESDQVTAAASWPQFQCGAAHAGVQRAETVLDATNVSQLAVAWQLAGVGAGYYGSSPVIADGALYIGDMNGTVKKVLNGSLQWTAHTVNGVFSTPAVMTTAAASTAKTYVYAADLSGFVYQIDAGDGSIQHQVLQTEDPVGGITVAGGRVYVLSQSGDLRAYDPQLDVLWSAQVGDPGVTSSRAAPTVVGGVVYVGDGAGHLYGLGAWTGEAQGWSPLALTTASGGPVRVSSTVAADGAGRLYAEGFAGAAAGENPGEAHLIAINASASSALQQWSRDLGDIGGPIFGDEQSPAVDGLGSGARIVVATNARQFAYDPAGNQLWAQETANAGSFCPSSPVIANGVIYSGGIQNSGLKQGQLEARRESDGVLLFHETFPHVMNTTPAVANGRVYIGGGNSGPSGAADDVLFAYQLAQDSPSPGTA